MPSNCSSTIVGAYGGPCPTDSKDAATCEGNIIIYCEEGCLTSAGNCHDALANYPPYGIHDAAVCWEEFPGAMNGQCTDDCVSVTMTNGTVFYPMI
ncbi:hypothetical protein VMCG_06645 [Cytospora schulzeri]|uniref:Uncharacterized protein n=1 Tax=Cytospora schulzeri TaxID=448051 RepID=A0A423W723_9PEZI|nr:hypothetical protein VMCG_06645 [Valsa malicola]